MLLRGSAAGRPERPPLRNHGRTWLERVELRIAATEPLTRAARQLPTKRRPLSQKPEPFENCPVLQSVRVFDDLGIIAIIALEIRVEAIGDVLNATSKRRVAQHVDDRSMHIGDRYSRPVPP